MGGSPNIYPQDGCKIEDPPTDNDISWFSGWGVLPVRKGIYFRHRSAFQRVLMAHLFVKSFGPFAQWLKHRLNRLVLDASMRNGKLGSWAVRRWTMNARWRGTHGAGDVSHGRDYLFNKNGALGVK